MAQNVVLDTLLVPGEEWPECVCQEALNLVIGEGGHWCGFELRSDRVARSCQECWIEPSGVSDSVWLLGIVLGRVARL